MTTSRFWLIVLVGLSLLLGLWYFSPGLFQKEKDPAYWAARARRAKKAKAKLRKMYEDTADKDPGVQQSA